MSFLHCHSEHLTEVKFWGPFGISRKTVRFMAFSGNRKPEKDVSSLEPSVCHASVRLRNLEHDLSRITPFPSAGKSTRPHSQCRFSLDVIPDLAICSNA
jgi:hypothetical protein